MEEMGSSQVTSEENTERSIEDVKVLLHHKYLFTHEMRLFPSNVKPREGRMKPRQTGSGTFIRFNI